MLHPPHADPSALECCPLAPGRGTALETAGIAWPSRVPTGWQPCLCSGTPKGSLLTRVQHLPGEMGPRAQGSNQSCTTYWFLIDLQVHQCCIKTGSSLKVYQHFSPKENPAACNLCNPSSPWHHHHQDLGSATQVSKSGIKIAVVASVRKKKKKAPNTLKPLQYSLKRTLGTSLQFIAVLGT